jgi:hypothetical protein
MSASDLARREPQGGSSFGKLARLRVRGHRLPTARCRTHESPLRSSLRVDDEIIVRHRRGGWGRPECGQRGVELEHV